MMSNCAFWSASGELLAVHGACSDDPRATFGPWAASLRLPSGRLVSVLPTFPLPPVSEAGWQTLAPVARRRKPLPPRICQTAVPVATPAPAFDHCAARLLPPLVTHEKFTLKTWPTWVATVQLERDEGPEGWYAALEENSKANRFLVRLVPHRGRLPGEGWRNMLTWSLRNSLGVRLVPLNGLPRAEILAAFPAWEYRVEAGRNADAAAWDVQVLPSRNLLLGWAPDATDPWEATALLRWIRPGSSSGGPPLPEALPESVPRWADLFARWSAADARLVVQNVLTTQAGGASASAALFFDAVPLAPGPDGRPLVRYVPQEGLPLALLSTLFGHRAWREIDRAKRFLPPADELLTRRVDALADLDQRLLEGRLVWSSEAESLWSRLYREPLNRARQAELQAFRGSQRWAEALAGDPLVLETLLRNLDVTDAALCLRDAPDRRWRRFVTARREAELKEELDFLKAWDARGELTVERQLEAWRSWDEIVDGLRLTEPERGN